MPSDRPLVTAPRLVELCFQTAGLWQAGREDVLALPMRVGSARVVGDPTNRPLRAHARETAPGIFDCVVVDADDNVVVHLDGYRTIPLPAPIPDDVSTDLHAAYRD